MARLIWDAVGVHFYETGVDRGVLYVGASPGVAWNGLTSVSESPSGGDPKDYYIDGVKHLNLPTSEQYEATIEAFTYPDAFSQCDGSVRYYGLMITNQPRKSFGLTYRTLIGNDVAGQELGYKIHLVYNALAQPSNRDNRSTDDNSTTTNFSWKITTRPPALTGYQRTAHFVIDSRHTDPAALAAVEDVLYGSTMGSASLPSPSDIMDILVSHATFTVVDNGDGTWTATGSEDVINIIDADNFEITSSAVTIIDADTYTLTST